VPGEHLQINLESTQRIHAVASSISANKQLAILYGQDTITGEHPAAGRHWSSLEQIEGA
jgi:hypothetical protein